MNYVFLIMSIAIFSCKTVEKEEFIEEEFIEIIEPQEKVDYTKIKFDTLYRGPLFRQESNEQRLNRLRENLFDVSSDIEPSRFHVLDDCLFCKKNAQLLLPSIDSLISGLGVRLIHKPPLLNILEVFDGEVNFNFKGFRGNNVPFEGSVSGDISEIFLDGRKVKFHPYEDLFFRQTLRLYPGYNKIPVRIVGNSGYVTDSWIVIEMEM